MTVPADDRRDPVRLATRDPDDLGVEVLLGKAVAGLEVATVLGWRG